METYYIIQHFSSDISLDFHPDGPIGGHYRMVGKVTVPFKWIAKIYMEFKYELTDQRIVFWYTLNEKTIYEKKIALIMKYDWLHNMCYREHLNLFFGVEPTMEDN